jgi:hypothetical protein
MSRRTGVHASSGTFSAGPLNAAKNLTGLSTEIVGPGSLSARVYWVVLTNAMTLTGKWQASTDNSTWRDIKPANNAAHVVLQTSTGTGAVHIEAPGCIAGNPYVRFSLVSGAASGSAGDTYSMSYSYVSRNGFETSFRF